MVYWSQAKKTYKKKPIFNYKKFLKSNNFDKLKSSDFDQLHPFRKYVRTIQPKISKKQESSGNDGPSQ